LLGVGWQASEPSAGRVIWSQGGKEQTGTLQENGTVQRAPISGYDISKPLTFRVESTPVGGGAAGQSETRKIPALVNAKGETSFLVFTDVHSDAKWYAKCLEQHGDGVNFIALCGDCVEDPKNEAHVVKVLTKPMAGLAEKGIPFLFLRGNHEMRGDGYWQTLPRHVVQREPDLFYGAVTLGTLRLIYLDTGETQPKFCQKQFANGQTISDYLEEQAKWLKQEVKSEAFRKAKYRLVLMHIPLNLRPNSLYPTKSLGALFAQTLNEAGVDVLLSGHDHGTNQIVPPPEDKWKDISFKGPVFVARRKGLMRVGLSAEGLNVKLFDSDGSVCAEQTWKR